MVRHAVQVMSKTSDCDLHRVTIMFFSLSLWWSKLSSHVLNCQHGQACKPQQGKNCSPPEVVSYTHSRETDRSCSFSYELSTSTLLDVQPVVLCPWWCNWDDGRLDSDGVDLILCTPSVSYLLARRQLKESNAFYTSSSCGGDSMENRIKSGNGIADLILKTARRSTFIAILILLDVVASSSYRPIYGDSVILSRRYWHNHAALHAFGLR